MKIKLNTYIVLGFVFLLGACNEKGNISTIAQHINMPENGLTKIKEIGPLTYTARYETPEIMTLKELGATATQTPEFKSLLQERKAYFQIVLRISSSNPTNTVSLFKSIAKDDQQMFELRNYFMNFAKTDFEFLVDGVSYSPSVYQFMASNGATPYEEIVIGLDYLAEEIDPAEEKIQLVYNDKIFKHGPIYFTYKIEDIKKIPPLNF